MTKDELQKENTTLVAEVGRLQAMVARLGGAPPSTRALASAEYSASKMEELLQQKQARVTAAENDLKELQDEINMKAAAASY